MSKIKNGGLDQYGKVSSHNGIGGKRVKRMEQRTTYLSLLVFNASPSLHIHAHLSSRWNWKRRLGVGGHALVSGVQNIGLSKHKLESALNCSV